jgi:hypothetical protein
VKISTEAALIGGAVIVGGLILWRGSKIAGGLVTGDNALTRNAKDASGAPVTAYQGAGVVGTLGAAANAASGGYLASFGEWLGSKAYDLFHPAPAKDASAGVLIGNGQPTTGDFARLDRSTYYTSGQSGSGSLVDRDIDYGYVNPMGDPTGW